MMQQATNPVRHGESTPFEAKSRFYRYIYRAARQGLACQFVVYSAFRELSGFKRRATAVLKANFILEFTSARQ